MPTVALMWEARAVPGRGAELLAWARERLLAWEQEREPRGERQPLRREVFTAPEDRVLVITWWEGEYDAVVPELPDPPGTLVRRTVHRWRFESVGG